MKVFHKSDKIVIWMDLSLISRHFISTLDATAGTTAQLLAEASLQVADRVVSRVGSTLERPTRLQTYQPHHVCLKKFIQFSRSSSRNSKHFSLYIKRFYGKNNFVTSNYNRTRNVLVNYRKIKVLYQVLKIRYNDLS